ncbi:MAG: hypothetical protein WKG07_47345 [Hymenobacter sp.]
MPHVQRLPRRPRQGARPARHREGAAPQGGRRHRRTSSWNSCCTAWPSTRSSRATSLTGGAQFKDLLASMFTMPSFGEDDDDEEEEKPRRRRWWYVCPE